MWDWVIPPVLLERARYSLEKELATIWLKHTRCQNIYGAFKNLWTSAESNPSRIIFNYSCTKETIPTPTLESTLTTTRSES